MTADVSECDVLQFEKGLPQNEQAVISYWDTKYHIDVDELPFHSTDTLFQILRLCRNLKVLKLTEKLVEIDLNGLANIIGRYCSKLEVLDIKAFELDEADLQALESLTSLKTLSITTSASDGALERLFQNNVALESVTIWKCDNAGGLCFNKLPNSTVKFALFDSTLDLNIVLDNLKLQNLEILHIPGNSINNKSMEKLIPCNKLKSLSIPLSDGFANRVLANNPDLDDLTIIDNNQFSIKTLQKLPTKLKSFTLEGDFLISKSQLFEMIQCLDLESLSMSDTEFTFTKEDDNSGFMEKLVQSAPNLKHLSIHLCGYMNFHCLKNLTKLKSLHLNCRGLPGKTKDRVLKMIAEKLQQLDVLELKRMEDTNCNSYTNVVRLPKLKELRLFKCCYRSIKVGLECQSLEILRFEECFSFVDTDALVIIKNLSTNLKCIHIENCSITKRLIQNAAQLLDSQKDRKSVLKLSLYYKISFNGQLVREQFVENTACQHPLLQLRETITKLKPSEDLGQPTVFSIDDE